MDAYIGFANFTMNAYPDGEPKRGEHVLDLRAVYKAVQPMSVRRPNNKIVKAFTINSVEVCSASRGCTPKSRFTNDKAHKHLNFLTVYKNGSKSLKTNKSKNKSKYVLLNIKGVCKIGDTFENVAIRVPKSGVVGVKVGLSVQKFLVVNDLEVDKKLDYLGYELEKLIYDLLPVPPMRPRKLSGLSIQGFNLNDPAGGQRPPHRLENFIAFMRLMDTRVASHFMDWQPRETKTLPRVSFKPKTEGPTVGITNWLMVDFTGIKTVASVRELGAVFFRAYNGLKNQIVWNMVYNGPIPKSRRKVETKKLSNKTSNTPNVNIDVPKWNPDKKRFVDKSGKAFACMRLGKKDIEKLALKLDVNPSGFKASVCERIVTKLNKNRK